MSVPSGDEVGGRGSRLHDALAIEELVAANRESNQTMVDLVEHVQRETEARDRKIAALEVNNRTSRHLSYLVAGAVVALLALTVINAFNIASAQRQQRSLQRINATLLDCVNSTGACGRANAQQQELTLDEVKKYSLVGFYCIRTNPALKDPKGELFLRCMNRLYPGGPTLTER